MIWTQRQISCLRAVAWRVWTVAAALLCILQFTTCLAAPRTWATRAVTQEGRHVQEVPDIRFSDKTYRKYVGERDKLHPWHNGVDLLKKRGYTMTPVQAPVEAGHLNTSLGPLALSADPPFISQDLYAAYHLDTVWPYCASIHECPVYIQQDSPAAPKAPMTLTLPPGVSAIDLYIDAAIDCVTTLRAIVKCKALVQRGDVEVKFSLSSVCASPFVGKYIAFWDASGDSITSLQLSCKTTVPTALGLLRIGTKQQADMS